MRALLSIVALASALPVAAAPAPPAAVARALDEAELRRYAEWVGRAMEISTRTERAFTEVSPRLHGISQQVRDAASAKAAAAQLSAVIMQVRPQLTANQAAMRALEPLPPQLDARLPFPTRRLQADLLTYGERMLATMDATLGLANAMAADDRAGAARHARALEQSATILVDGQITLVRARQAMVPASDSVHQALGLMDTLYQTMALLLRQRFERGAWPAERLRALAAQADALSAAGDRANAAKLQAATRVSGGSAQQRQHLATLTAAFTAERETFVIGRELAATLRGLAAGAGSDPATQFAQLTAIESRIMAVSQRQAELLASSNAARTD